MNKTKDKQLENAFLILLLEADPQISAYRDFVREFAGHLADFADAWAENPESIAAHERWLNDWVESYAEHTHAAMATDSYGLYGEEENAAVADYDDEDDDDLVRAEME